VGVLYLESDRVNAFGEEDVYVLETLSGQIASSMKNAKLYSEIRDFSRMLQTKVEEKTARTEALLETSYALRETTSWEIGLNTIVEGIVKSLKFESAALLLLNERTAMLESKAVAGTDVGMENIKLPLSDTQPVAVKCVKEKRAINIKDGATDSRVEAQVGTQMSSFAWVPILSQNEALGAIGVANPESGTPIDDEGVEILILYANAAALFLEKTRYLVSPAIEKRLSTQLKYKLPPMEGFLIFEEKADHAFDVFCDLVTHGMEGFCMSRMAPDLIRKKYRLEKTPIMWLSHSSTKESIDPQDLGKMNHIITEFLHKAEDGVVLLEGLEYLITENDFPRVIKALHALSDAIVLSNARLILPFNPKTLSEKELSILEREFNMLKP
jgi:GAF domain-containing protein